MKFSQQSIKGRFHREIYRTNLKKNFNDARGELLHALERLLHFHLKMNDESD